jgi:hypothetical protein
VTITTGAKELSAQKAGTIFSRRRQERIQPTHAKKLRLILSNLWDRAAKIAAIQGAEGALKKDLAQ